MRKTFKKAWIFDDHGVIKISTSPETGYWDKHYDVVLNIDSKNNLFILTGDKAEYTYYRKGYGNLDQSLYLESAFEEKTSFWTGKIKIVLREGYLEKKETTPVTYTGNNYLIIEE